MKLLRLARKTGPSVRDPLVFCGGGNHVCERQSTADRRRERMREAALSVPFAVR